MAISCKKSVIPSLEDCQPCQSDTCVIVQDGDTTMMQYRMTADGSTLISNGLFASSSGWTTGAGWSIGGGVATFSTTPSTLSRTTDIVLTPGWYAVIIKFTNTGAATSIEVKLGGVSMSIITAFPEDNRIAIYKYLTPGSNLLEIVGAAPSGAINIDSIVVNRMSELEYDIRNCDTDTVITHRTYANGDITYFETGDIDTDAKYHAASGAGNTIASGVVLLPAAEAQINIVWASLGIANGCYCICVKDHALLGLNQVSNGDFHNSDFWAITNGGGPGTGWALAPGVVQHTPGGAGDDVLRQTLTDPLDATLCYNLDFTIASVSGSGNATLTVKYDTATLTDQVLDSTVYSSFPQNVSIPIIDTAVTKIKFVMNASGLRVISLDDIVLTVDADCLPCECETSCVSYRDSWDDIASARGLCNMMLTASNDNNALGYNYEYFTFAHYLRVLGNVRNAKYEFTDEEYYKKSDGETILVSTGYNKSKELQVMRLPEGAHDILSLMLIHQNFTVTVNGVTTDYVKRPGAMSPQWTRRRADAYVIVDIIEKTQDYFNFLG